VFHMRRRIHETRCNSQTYPRRTHAYLDTSLDTCMHAPSSSWVKYCHIEFVGQILSYRMHAPSSSWVKYCHIEFVGQILSYRMHAPSSSWVKYCHIACMHPPRARALSLTHTMTALSHTHRDRQTYPRRLGTPPPPMTIFDPRTRCPI